jgi:hypothetical protein
MAWLRQLFIPFARAIFCGMKRVLLVVAFIVVSAVFVVGQSGPALAVRLRFAKNQYSIHDKIELEIVRENVSNERLAVSSLWFWGVMRTDIHVFDEGGHEVRTDFLADSVPYPPKPYDFVVLEPGEFIGTGVRESVKQFVNVPGEYDFEVEYTSEISEDWARKVLQLPPDVPFWSRERRTISSPRIRVRITP